MPGHTSRPRHEVTPCSDARRRGDPAGDEPATRVTALVDVRDTGRMSDRVRACRQEPGGKDRLPLPTTKRGLRTRSNLVEHARRVFEEQGYLDTVVADIAKASGVAHGTFYKYFTSKQDVFHEVALDLQERMIGRMADSDAERPRPAPDERSPDDWRLRIEATNRAYLIAYRENARLLALVEQVATFNDEMLDLRRAIRADFVRRATSGVARLQRAGLAHDDVDARYVASALGSMVDRFAYVWLVLGEEFELEQAVATLTALWLRAVGLGTTELADPTG